MRWATRLGDWLVKLVIIGVLAGLVGFVFLTNFPRSPPVQRAMTWPVVGSLIAKVQRVWAPPPPERPPGEDREPPEGPMIMIPPPQRVGSGPSVWLEPEMNLREEPSKSAKSLGFFTLYANVDDLEQRGDWHRVRYRGLEGWVHIPSTSVESDEPPLGREPEPPGPLPPRPADPTRLAAARNLLGDEKTTSLGPYTLHTDHAVPVLHDRMARLATTLDDHYAERFGRTPIGTPAASVVLFGDESAYRRFERSSALAGARSTGHATGGLVALWADGRDLDEVCSTFVHELVHLINRRALGPALPPWLDEGLAEAMDLSRIDADGTLHPERLGGRRWEVGEEVTYLGARASLHRLRVSRSAGTWPPLSGLLALDAATFRGEDPTLHYDLSGFFVRYLLDGEDGRFTDAFEAFLDDVASGQPPTTERLRARLGVSWQALDAGFAEWVGAIPLNP